MLNLFGFFILLTFLTLLSSPSSVAKILVRASDIQPHFSNGKFFEVIIDRFELVYENKDIFEWIIRVRKVNKTRFIVGKVIVKVPLGDEVVEEIRSMKKQGWYEVKCLMMKKIIKFIKNDLKYSS
jgi:hypothetical protein